MIPERPQPAVGYSSPLRTLKGTQRHIVPLARSVRDQTIRGGSGGCAAVTARACGERWLTTNGELGHATAVANEYSECNRLAPIWRAPQDARPRSMLAGHATVKGRAILLKNPESRPVRISGKRQTNQGCRCIEALVWTRRAVLGFLTGCTWSPTSKNCKRAYGAGIFSPRLKMDFFNRIGQVRTVAPHA
jgi:hypothetical protein